MIEQVRQYLERQHMAEWHEPLWVGVSGGVDSMVLLHLVQALRHPVSVVHVDHGLRGTESDADLDFVRSYCDQHQISFTYRKVDVKSLVETRGISVQMAARELRYAVFRECIAAGPAKVALAHHQDDAIETLFIQLMQGMGVNGWRTIAPVSGGIIRPLMQTSRAEILSYAEEHGIRYREDASNAEQKYLRNKIRHELMPMLESWRPGVRRSLSRSIDLLREMDHVVQGHLNSQL
ncbi:MAG: tRNA lysidine(34) synthetase TilS, partial [Bacteroidota bacterium]|nr:tRNA lysidine(34) synthetase TilS [Bacteroidota bacterium]